MLLAATLFNVVICAEVYWGETSRDKRLTAVEVNSEFASEFSCMPCLYNGYHWCPAADGNSGSCFDRPQIKNDDGEL